MSRRYILIIHCNAWYHHPLDGVKSSASFDCHSIAECEEAAKREGWILNNPEKHGDMILKGDVCPNCAAKLAKRVKKEKQQN